VLDDLGRKTMAAIAARSHAATLTPASSPCATR
jgi:hypothetical protein